MFVVLDHIEPITSDIRTFWFKPEGRMRYVAGQYLDIYLPHANPDNRGAVRTMSLSSSPTESLVGVTTAFEQQGGSSFKNTLSTLRSGDRLMFTDPMGDFILPKDPSIPLVFVVGGLGVTPIRSMVKWLLDKKEKRDIQLVYMATSPETMLYLPLLESYFGPQLTRLYTRQAPQGMQVSARPITKELLALIGDVDKKLIYLAGPQPMMEAYWQKLQEYGVSRDQLVLDYFTGYTKY